MLGINDFWIWSAYLLCFVAAGGCILYGILNWNKGMDEEPEPSDKQWSREEKAVDETL